ncbi:unnamed protein product [Adineta ricciae]|uniref:Uncharacterized protein n=1 Tax=Adineta ricciae TaxID=249248 RepID=A0A814BJ20_ADIRI|nr:unnamed protein product [Adineta ricciae]CAF1617076.1 unnamed protein product [Adineta ricciae]
MVRCAKTKQIERKKLSDPQTNSADQSSSKILHVVRQALLNAAAELVAQQKTSAENPQTSNLNMNENATKKKAKKTIVARKKTRRK